MTILNASNQKLPWRKCVVSAQFPRPVAKLAVCGSIEAAIGKQTRPSIALRSFECVMRKEPKCTRHGEQRKAKLGEKSFGASSDTSFGRYTDTSARRKLPSFLDLDRYRSINAVVESFFNLLKRERIRRRVYRSREDARRDVFYYIEMFYNPKRKHARNGMLSPIEFERQNKIQTEGDYKTRGYSGPVPLPKGRGGRPLPACRGWTLW